MSFLLGHFLNGIAEHGARHLVGMQMEEIAEEVHGYALAHLTEHPADCFMHQVVGMMEMNLCVAQAPRRVALLRGFPRADNAHALFPKAGALRQFVEDLELVVSVA